MADYLIQGSTLDAIAEAINHKAGTQATMTPAEMVTAIGNIPGGGGGSALIAQYVASEPVHAGRVDFTQNMLGYDGYFIVVEGTPSKIEYPCPAFNEEPITQRYGPKVEANEHFAYCIPLFKILSNSNFSSLAGGSSPVTITGTLQYFKVAGFYADSLFSNFKISVYGVKFQ